MLLYFRYSYQFTYQRHHHSLLLVRSSYRCNNPTNEIPHIHFYAPQVPLNITDGVCCCCPQPATPKEVFLGYASRGKNFTKIGFHQEIGSFIEHFSFPFLLIVHSPFPLPHHSTRQRCFQWPCVPGWACAQACHCHQVPRKQSHCTSCRFCHRMPAWEGL